MAVHKTAQTCLLATDAKQTPLAEFAGAALQRVSYSPYGHQSASAPLASRTGFNGQLREPQGWYHLGNGHRIYNPVLRRFHSPDHLSPFSDGGLNLYSYCLGDPINYTDPTGRAVNWLGRNPFHSLLLNVSLLVANVVASVLVPPAGLTLWSARLSMVGATTGIVGASMQMGGAEAGKAVSIVGTFVSMAGVAMRAGLGVQTLYQTRATLRPDLGNRLKNMFLGGYKAPPAPSVVQPVASPPASPPISPGSAISRPLSPGSFNSLSSHASTVKHAPVTPSDVSPGSFTSNGLSETTSSIRTSIRTWVI
ncbi:RHS repeat-associated core domain-containing protein [Pseudomonas sp. 5P_5.1_Bac1]|uniref:RHS repeat-associated core domain-containing protein n=1 Tax=Pseudomonas sp. 5P_5.1_Bac1 TaxID=2971616 RepID=UPI0021C88D9B|nr:RHS repeat-associated core domain-containing protein [Pseudomonas sp. 5P_5.1_Bac1]MCU1722060.1 RHS repeat-associated core domain-containing protein [Pseudomonas sp. 5P_5.1_Bac1]